MWLSLRGWPRPRPSAASFPHAPLTLPIQSAPYGRRWNPPRYHSDLSQGAVSGLNGRSATRNPPFHMDTAACVHCDWSLAQPGW